MTAAPETLEVFKGAVREAVNLARDLAFARDRVAPLIPLSAETIRRLAPDEKLDLDGFSHRFAKLQDVLGRKCFRGLLFVEQALDGDMASLDIMVAIGQRGIILDLDLWKFARRLRNALEHEYPDDDARKAEILNRAHVLSTDLIGTLVRLREYAQVKHSLALPD